MNAGKSRTTIMKETQAKEPMPNAFDVYLPWAYGQFDADRDVVIQKITQNEYINVGSSTGRSKSRGKSRKQVPESESDDDEKSTWHPMKVKTKAKKTIVIIATYDNTDKLVQLTFDKNLLLPRKMLRIIGMIIQYQPYLTTITINRGLDKFTIYEMKKWLPVSAITDICLDGTFIEEANYHILLTTPSSLRNLSVARCQINDEVVKNLASGLTFPSPASKKLAILNLASNKITDLGAMYLGNALRTNRKLYYLNLADNIITDDGALSILNVLIEFPVTAEEFSTMKSKFMVYLNEKEDLSTRILRDLKTGDYDKRINKKKPMKPLQSLAKKSKAYVDVNKSQANLEEALREKADVMAVAMLGEFNDPFSTTHTEIKDDIRYCLGNNVLCYINLAYNNLGYISLKKLLKVVETQRRLDRKPKGLLNVCIEGNNLPTQCRELANIDDILNTGLTAHSKITLAGKKKSICRAITK